MTGRVLLVAAAAAASGLASDGQTRPGDQPAVFRAEVDAVSVDVSVRSGGRPVIGLTAKAFVLLDNGVRQQIEIVDVEAVPLDVSLLIDTSGSASGFVDQLKSDVRTISSLLRPGDRLRLLTIDSYVNEILPMQPPTGRQEPRPLTANGLTALYDALAASMLRPTDANRRQIVIAITDGIDTVSALELPALRAVAERSEATLHIARLNAENVRSLMAFQCQNMGWCSPSKRFWIPFQEEHPDLLAEIARMTGGELHEPGILTGSDPVGIFKRILEDVRQSYVLRFMPSGAGRAGWHALTVRVPGAPSYVVRARRGYAYGVTGPPAEARNAAPIWASGARRLPPDIEPIVSLYDRGDYDSAVNALNRLPDPARFVRDLRAAGNPWPANPRREAAFVIEVAEAVFRNAIAARGEAIALLESYQPLIRNPLGADAFERLWYWAELTSVEGIIRPDVALRFVTNAQKRWPGEPRFLLARAIALDQFSPLGTPGPEHAEEALQIYNAAVQFESSAPDARLRQAFLLHRLGRHAEALALLDSVPTPPRDRVLAYLGLLFRGHFHEALDRADLAEKSYRQALENWPGAQAPRVGLMTLLFRRGERASAEQNADQVLTAQPQTTDPWWQYWQADYRYYPAAIAALREAAR